MTCREYQEFFSDLHDGELADGLRRDLEAHLGACPSCAAEHAAFLRSLKALRAAAAPAASPGFVLRAVAAARREPASRPSTRRLAAPAPRRAPWAVLAAAAAVLVAFTLGSLLQKDAAEARLEALRIENEKLRGGAPGPSPGPSRLPDGMAAVDGRLVPVAELVEREFARRGLVKRGEAWVSAELQDRLERGEMLVAGKWVRADEELARRIDEWKKANPPDAPAPSEEELLAKLGLVRRERWILPRDLADALAAGKVVGADGAARDPGELVDAALAELGLVRHGGRWMSAEQRAELLAQQKVRRSEFLGQETAVTRLLDDLTIGPPRVYKNLLLYPLSAAKDRAPAVETLHEASADGRVDLLDDYTALQVHVRNRGTAEVLLQAGEVLAAGRHGRVVARDVIVPPGRTAIVDVFDAEPTVFRTANAFAKESGHYLAPLGILRALHADLGQAGVWSALWTAQGHNATSVRDLFNVHRSAVFEYRAALFDLKDSDPGVTGVAIAVGDRLVAAHVYGRRELFAAAWDRLLGAAALEAVLAAQSRDVRAPSDPPASAAAVKLLLEGVFPAEHEVADGIATVRRNERVFARGCVSGGEAVHLAVLPDGAPDARTPGDVPGAKLKAVLDGYAVRLKQAPPARRPAIAAETALLPGAIASEWIEERTREGDAALRRAFAEGLASRRDPRAQKAQLKALPEWRRDPAVHPLLALAVARQGSEDGVQALLRELDPKFPEAARSAAEVLPAALLALDRPGQVERALEVLVVAAERLERECPAEELRRELDPQGRDFNRRLMERVTLVRVDRVSDYAKWWADPRHRDEFLKSLESRRR